MRKTKTRGFLVAAGVSLAMAFTLSCSGDEASLVESEIEKLEEDTPKPVAEPGKDGKDGIDGNHGIDGKDGADGKDGNHGVDGKDGADGIDGNHGKDGEKGEAGEKGDKGDTGEKGADGKDGANGTNGKDGAKGDKGDTGEKGADGINGKDGKDGADGKDADCEVVSDETGAYFIMECGGVEKARWAKAMCGTKAYDPDDPDEQRICKRGDLVLPTFTDKRDEKKYKFVKIGNQIWMAENLNFAAEGSKCYKDDEANCSIYGRLYNWETAMNNASSSTANPSGVQGVCPDGWHLPSDAEWEALMTAVGGFSTAGTKLKAKSGWNDYNEAGNGTDQFMFSALPGGYSNSRGTYNGVGTNGHLWSATDYGTGQNAHFLAIYYGNAHVNMNGCPKTTDKYSVRCVQN